jgi:murein endopeptidase
VRLVLDDPEDREPTPARVSATTIGLGLAVACSIAALALTAAVYVEVRNLEERLAEAPAVEPSLFPVEASGPAPAHATSPAADDAAPDVGAMGQSVGSARGGALYGGTRLPPGDGYFIRHPNRVYGTSGTVRHLVAAIEASRSGFSRLHRLSVGDLSGEVGGLLPGHLSHQSGRDVDLGLYYRERPPNYPKQFAVATRENLHMRATWALLEALCATADEPEGVEWILLDYRVQRILFEFARARRISASTLERVFQYPRGPTAEVGIVRHFPGHEDHVHVRFKCSTADVYCQPGEGPWRRLDREGS